MPKLTFNLVALAGAGLAACSGAGISGSAETQSFRVVPTSEVEWGPLNPARGDKGPKAGTLWGDRAGTGPSGFLVEFLDGFESPPHIHNVSYRGVVISGLVHNDDLDADEMWLPAGSYWTQPKGDVHITAAKGSRNLAYIEIEEGPYLVLPVDEEFESGEVSINVDESNLVWLDLPGARAPRHGPKVSFLWGEPQGDELYGTLVELPAGFAGALRSHGSTLHAVVIRGRSMYQVRGEAGVTTLDPGSHFSSKGEATHRLACGSEEGCFVYVRSRGKYEVIPGEPER